MSDFLDNLVLMTIAALFAFIFYGFGWVVFSDTQARFEQCIAADKQWVSGSCVTGQWFFREMAGADLKGEQP